MKCEFKRVVAQLCIHKLSFLMGWLWLDACRPTHDLFARLLPVAILGYWCEMVNLLKKEISFVFLESQVCISVPVLCKLRHLFIICMTLLAEIKHLLGDTLLCHHDSGSAVTCCVLMCT